MIHPINTLIIPNSDIEALSNSNICFNRKNRKCGNSNLLLGIQKDQTGSQRLVLVNTTIVTIWNRILSLFGWGPLQGIDCKIKSVSKYLENKWSDLSISVKDDFKTQERIKCIATRGRLKGELGLWKKSPLLLNDLCYLGKNAPDLLMEKARSRFCKSDWYLTITDPPLVPDDYDDEKYCNLSFALSQFPEEEFEETIHYFRQLKEICPESPHLFEKLREFPKEERAEAIFIFASLVEKFPQLDTSDHSFFDLILHTQQYLRSCVINKVISLRAGKPPISFAELEEMIACIEIIFRAVEKYPSEHQFIASFPPNNILFATYEPNFNRKSREKRFIAFSQIIETFLTYPLDERKEIHDNLPAIIKVIAARHLNLILSELAKISYVERASILHGYLLIADKLKFQEYYFPALLSALLKIPFNEREGVCAQLNQVLKELKAKPYQQDFIGLLDEFRHIPKEVRYDVADCIRTIFIQEKLEVFPEITSMVIHLSDISVEMIKSQMDIFLFFKEMKYTPHRIDRILTEKRFPIHDIIDCVTNIRIDKRYSILTKLSPLQGKVPAYPLFNLFLALSEMSDEEENKIFDALTMEQWRGILTSMPPNRLDLIDKMITFFSDMASLKHLHDLNPETLPSIYKTLLSVYDQANGVVFFSPLRIIPEAYEYAKQVHKLVLDRDWKKLHSHLSQGGPQWKNYSLRMLNHLPSVILARHFDDLDELTCFSALVFEEGRSALQAAFTTNLFTKKGREKLQNLFDEFSQIQGFETVLIQKKPLTT